MAKAILTPEILAPYLQIESEQSIRPAEDFTKQVMDYYVLGEDKTGYKMPWPILDEKFRLRTGECTILGGVNSSGKSLALGQVALNCMAQGAKVLSVSLEMSPRSQLIRLWRQTSLKPKPDINDGLELQKWTKDKLYFFDKEGSIDMPTLEAGIRYSIDHYATDLILVDSLMTISGIKNDDYTAQKDVVCRLCDLARDLEVHIILVAHARKSFSVSDKIDRFSIRGAGVDADCYIAISKARHWDMAECEIDLWMDRASLNLLMADQVAKSNLPSYKGREESSTPSGEAPF